MGKKINDTSEFPATVPAATDRFLGVDVSDTSNDANGETVTFTFNAVPVSILNNDSGFITDYTVTEADVTAHEAALTITESQISDLGSYVTVSGALRYQSTTTIAADTPANIELTGGFTQYQLRIIHASPATDDVTFGIRISTDGGSSFVSTSNYDYDYRSTLLNAASTTTEVPLAFGAGNVITEAYCGVVDIFLADGSSRNRVQAAGSYRHNGGTLYRVDCMAELNNSTTAATDIQLFCSSGNHSAKYVLYGIAESA